MAATTELKKMITLCSSDGEEFEIEVIVAKKSQTIKHDCVESVIPLPNVNSRILSKVIEYSAKRVDSSSKSDEKTADEELKAWVAEFVKVDQATLFDMILISRRRSCEGRKSQRKGEDKENVESRSILTLNALLCLASAFHKMYYHPQFRYIKTKNM